MVGAGGRAQVGSGQGVRHQHHAEVALELRQQPVVERGSQLLDRRGGGGRGQQQELAAAGIDQVGRRQAQQCPHAPHHRIGQQLHIGRAPAQPFGGGGGSHRVDHALDAGDVAGDQQQGGGRRGGGRQQGRGGARRNRAVGQSDHGLIELVEGDGGTRPRRGHRPGPGPVTFEEATQRRAVCRRTGLGLGPGRNKAVVGRLRLRLQRCGSGQSSDGLGIQRARPRLGGMGAQQAGLVVGERRIGRGVAGKRRQLQEGEGGGQGGQRGDHGVGRAGHHGRIGGPGR